MTGEPVYQSLTENPGDHIFDMNQDETDGEKNTGIGTLYYMQLQYKLYCSTFELHPCSCRTNPC